MYRPFLYLFVKMFYGFKCQIVFWSKRCQCGFNLLTSSMELTVFVNRVGFAYVEADK